MPLSRNYVENKTSFDNQFDIILKKRQRACLTPCFREAVYIGNLDLYHE